MPIALQDSVCDSEDESDELALINGNESNNDAIPARLPGPSEKPLQGPNAHHEDSESTRSAERLHRQIQDTETALCKKHNDSTTLGATPSEMISFESIQNRSHTASVPEHQTHSSERPSNRSKGSTARESVISDVEQINGDANAPVASSRFTEHSIPCGSTKGATNDLASLDDFIAHEPHILFLDSGSTVPDNSSIAQALVEQHLHRPQPTTFQMEAQSSSMPWTASDIATQDNESNTCGLNNDTGKTRENLESDVGTEANPAHVPFPIEVKNGSINDDMMKDIISRLGSRGQRSSPQVVIPPASLGRRVSQSRRQQHQKVNEPSSENVIVDLPMERYQPRPSKRRAKAMVEDPIDYSIVPEKAAKLKRIKSGSAKRQTPQSNSKDIFDVDESPKSHKRSANNVSELSGNNNGGGDELATADSTDQNSRAADSTSDAQDSAVDQSAISDHTHELKDRSMDLKRSASESRPRSLSKIPPPTSPLQDERNGAVGTANKSQSKKTATRRGHTTVYEDHIDSNNPKSLSNLSQQQTERKSSVLDDIKNEASPRDIKTRQSSVPKDSEDEDELALSNTEYPPKHGHAVTSDDQPKRRGRGRPPKTTTMSDAKLDEGGLEPNCATDEPLLIPKRGRGRPAKVQQPPAELGEDAEIKVATPKKRGRPRKSTARPFGGENEDPSGDKVETAGVVDPFPELPVTAEEAASDLTKTVTEHTDQVVKAGPESTPPPMPSAERRPTHSPSRNSAQGLKLRVGLSKRSRIPPLLKMIKPPAPRRKS
ncbi:hypothetical protein K431DRAFT_344403 [Polychaeton citri CBS 116435]|uniref:Uncharacterized protein n=1 Tax=Polychaeton citri CBS 116435 TaxID=1314669 RepID=A0A9P4QFS1_9PEZI|nr:hypothetical protein K431DRAFT_344403 [Polychaeton citri CBS 116435]